MFKRLPGIPYIADLLVFGDWNASLSQKKGVGTRN
jgi:hypothetical protein